MVCGFKVISKGLKSRLPQDRTGNHSFEIPAAAPASTSRTARITGSVPNPNIWSIRKKKISIGVPEMYRNKKSAVVRMRPQIPRVLSYCAV